MLSDSGHYNVVSLQFREMWITKRHYLFNECDRIVLSVFYMGLEACSSDGFMDKICAVIYYIYIKTFLVFSSKEPCNVLFSLLKLLFLSGPKV